MQWDCRSRMACLAINRFLSSIVSNEAFVIYRQSSFISLIRIIQTEKVPSYRSNNQQLE